MPGDQEQERNWGSSSLPSKLAPVSAPLHVRRTNRGPVSIALATHSGDDATEYETF